MNNDFDMMIKKSWKKSKNDSEELSKSFDKEAIQNSMKFLLDIAEKHYPNYHNCSNIAFSLEVFLTL